jgi:hypothetical protein
LPLVRRRPGARSFNSPPLVDTPLAQGADRDERGPVIRTRSPRRARIGMKRRRCDDSSGHGLCPTAHLWIGRFAREGLGGRSPLCRQSSCAGASLQTVGSIRRRRQQSTPLLSRSCLLGGRRLCRTVRWPGCGPDRRILATAVGLRTFLKRVSQRYNGVDSWLRRRACCANLDRDGRRVADRDGAAAAVVAARRFLDPGARTAPATVNQEPQSSRSMGDSAHGDGKDCNSSR